MTQTRLWIYLSTICTLKIQRSGTKGGFKLDGSLPVLRLYSKKKTVTNTMQGWQWTTLSSRIATCQAPALTSVRTTNGNVKTGYCRRTNRLRLSIKLTFLTFRLAFTKTGYATLQMIVAMDQTRPVSCALRSLVKDNNHHFKPPFSTIVCLDYTKLSFEDETNFFVNKHHQETNWIRGSGEDLLKVCWQA